MILPDKKQEASKINPESILIYSHPKCGKTRLLSELENCLIVDFEKGSDFYDSMSVKIESLDDLKELITALKENPTKYKYIALDTITSVLDKVGNELAIELHNKEKMNANNQISLSFDITQLEYGRGYGYQRKAIQSIIRTFSNFCETIIVLGHTADKAATTSMVSATDVSLPGKLKNIICLKMDAIGFLHRKFSGQNYLSFIHSDEVLGGTRAKHLNNKEFLISEMKENDELETHWDKIFI